MKKFIHESENFEQLIMAVSFEKKIDRVGILWLKSQSRGEDKSGDKIKGKNWEIHESARSQEENLDIFKSVHKIFSLENPKHKPASESFVTSAKRNTQ